MKNRILHTLLITFFCLNGFMAFSQYVFNNAAGDNLWSNASNWAFNAIPPANSSNNIVINGNCTAIFVEEQTRSGSLTINTGQSLTIDASGQGPLNRASKWLNNGTIINHGTFTVRMHLENSPTGVITNNSILSLQNSLLSGGNSHLNNYGTWTNNSQGNVIIEGGFTSNGHGSSGAIINNYGVINIPSNGGIWQNHATNTFNNYGSFMSSKTVSGGFPTNHGIMNISGSNAICTLNYFENYGTFNLITGANLILNGIGRISGTFNWGTGTTITLNAALYIDNSFSVPTGATLIINTNAGGSLLLVVGGTLTNLGTIQLNGSGSILINGTLTNQGVFRANPVLTGTGQISNTGTFCVTCLVVNGVNTPTLCQSSNNSVLCGTGSLPVCPTIGGLVGAGCSAGGLTLIGNVTYTGTIQAEINGTTANSQYDVINFSNTLTLGAGSTLEVVWGFTPAAGNTFVVLTCGSRIGEFSTINIPSVAGLYFVVNYNPTNVSISAYAIPTNSVSTKSGNWSDASTWLAGVMPTSVKDVTIQSGHTVVMDGLNRQCRNLSCNGNLDIPFGTSLLVNSDGSPKAGFGGNSQMTVSNNLTLSGGSLAIGGRLFFNEFASFDMTPNSTITINPMGADALHSILDAPIIESNLTEANTNISGGVIQISATHPNLTEPLISGNLDLRANGCPAVGANLKIPFSINSTYQFGGLGNPQLFLEPTNPTIDSLHALGGTGRNFIFLGTNIERNATISGATITGTDCKFNGFTLSDVVWKGSFEMRTNCRGTAPIFKNDGNVSTHATDFNLKINTNDKATFDLSGAGVSPYFNLLGTLNLVNGKVMVKGGTLDLRMATVQGLSANRFFMTEHGTNNTLGAVLLPVVANNVNPVTFNLGVSIPNGANPPTNVYAPISVLSTNGRAMMWR